MMDAKNIGNPFPGLRPFETDEYGLFFGREGQSDALIERLQRSHFLAVVGTSGSGKSSLVRAGLLPALRGGMMAGAGSGWRIAIMRPGNDPIGNLAAALAEKAVLLEAGGGLPAAEAEAVIEATLRRGSLGLVDATRQARLEQQKLLVVVDQFEELFRFRAARTSNTGDDASAFVKLLLEAAQQSEIPIYVVPTMRSDFLGDCAQFQGLPEAINDGQYLIPRMTRDERRFAITGPVGVTRGKISESLVNRLMNDVGDNPDQLPILQHALMRTWDFWAAHHRNGEPIGLDHYEAVGTMADALSIHADEAFNELPNERSRMIAESLFKTLTERGADNREIRRPTCLRDICAIAGASAAEVVTVVDVFRGGGRSFLMPPAGVALLPETVIDISHESLIRNWARLKEWVRDEAEAARIYRRLAEAAMAYRTGEGGLLDDVTLQWVFKWRDKYLPTRAWAVRYHPEFDAAMAHLEESHMVSKQRIAEAHEREQRELERARAFAEQQARSARRLRWLTAALGVILVFALFTAGAAVYAQRKAVREQQKTAEAQRLTEQERLRVAAALEDTKAAKVTAERSEAAAKKLLVFAKGEEAKAEDQKQRADEEAKRAQLQAKQASVARHAAEQRALALQANGKFRDATILAERGEYPEAATMYEATIKGLQENGVKDREGVADTYVQLGQVHFSAMKGTDFRVYGDYAHVGKAIESYDQAAKHYQDAGLPMKAAETLFSVGGLLLKIANDVHVGRRITPASEELASLARPQRSTVVGGLGQFEDDPKVKLKNQALERYKQAFELYRQAGNGDGTMKTAYRIGNFYLRNELPVWLDTTQTLAVDECRPSRKIVIENQTKALCYFKELERLSLANHPDDSRIQRLLIWIGALSLQANDGEAAETYFTRAQRSFLDPAGEDPSFKIEPEVGWFDAAQVSEEAGLYDAALNLYQRALAGYKNAKNYPGQAQTYFRIGQLSQKNAGNSGSAEDALSQFKLAVEASKQSLKSDSVSYSLGQEFFTIGAFAEDVSDEDTALAAYNVARELGEKQGLDELQARAWSSIAAIQSQHEPEIARQSYMRSFSFYSKMRQETAERYTVPMPQADEYLKELERISAAVLSLDREIKAKSLAEHRTQAAESLCPFPLIAYAQPTATDGDSISFSAYAAYAGASKLNYEWTLNSPTASIVERVLKPYPAIRVNTEGIGKMDLIATLVVTDGSGATVCKQTAQATTKVAAKPQRTH
ncbi:MAG TPA: hypothetical protein VGO68_12685 [Pyrinomonadaceae bacterium]|jgi:tetratricopeptide (TPR) repeat protein|nr:hypothetical protein [Pyrinomonadaceae bacterium]